MKQLIYIAEDEENIRELLRCTLESFGYAVEAFDTAAPLLERLKAQPLPSLILLDIMMPGIDGLSALRTIKAERRTKRIPVILITAKSGEVDKVTGLDMGADDYIAKPFGLLELTARVRAALRRNEEPDLPPMNTLVSMDLVVNLDSREVLCGGRPLELTLKEFELLRLLMQNYRRVVTRDEILEAVWGYDYVGETRTLDMHIKTLRAKLGDDAENPRYIKTVRGVGYRFMAECS